jgi:hypothetical protein
MTTMMIKRLLESVSEKERKEEGVEGGVIVGR